MKRLEIDEAAERVYNLLQRHDAGNPDAGAGLREKRRSSSGAGGHGGADRGSIHDLRNPAGRYEKGFRRLMSFLLACPQCGERSAYEFRFGGEVKSRPQPDAERRRLVSHTSTRKRMRPANRKNGGSTATAATNGFKL